MKRIVWACVVVACSWVSARVVHADTSSWSGRVGTVGLDDRTTWCKPEIKIAGNGRRYAESRFNLHALDGTVLTGVTNPFAEQRVKVQCFASANLTGPSSVLTSGWSTDGAADVVSTLQCPLAQPHAGYARCQVRTPLLPPYVYAGSNCGDGVADLSGNSQLRGQLTGQSYEISPSFPVLPLFNNTSAQAGIWGTDLGYSFLAQGYLYFGFGDSWENDANLPGLLGFRGSVLTRTTDFDPSDANGIAFTGWDTMPFNPFAAREIVPSPHNYFGTSEITAIATSGFGLTEGFSAYRFVWFDSIRWWDPFISNESTLAWSVNGGAFVRGDQQPFFDPPRWLPSTFFGPGAIWVDREEGYIYFFGVKTYVPGSPIRVARVRGISSAVVNHLEYEYWNGSDWEFPDPNDEYAIASDPSPALDLIPASHNPRPEMSVAYNSYVGRFIMLIHNDDDLLVDPGFNTFEMWESRSVTGPWEQVPVSAKLPTMQHLYGAYMSEHTMRNGGQDVYFAMSEWSVVTPQPYNVGLWKMSLVRETVSGCTP